MKSLRITLAVFAVSSSLAASCFAQEKSVASVSAEPAVMTALQLMREIEQHELALYELFNAVNSSDEFDVACRSEVVENSDLSLQFCEPAFLQKIRQQVISEQAADASADNGIFAKIRNAFVSKDERLEKLARERAAASIELMQQEMETLANSNSQLAVELQTVGQLQLAYLKSVRGAVGGSAYRMQQSEPNYGRAFSGGFRTESPRPTLGPPPAGHSQPSIRFPADVSVRFRQ